MRSAGGSIFNTGFGTMLKTSLLCIFFMELRHQNPVLWIEEVGIYVLYCILDYVKRRGGHT